MEHVKKATMFWVLLIASVIVPSVANAQTTQLKKMMWTATITAPNSGPLGYAQLVREIRRTWNAAENQWVTTSDIVKYLANTTGFPCASSPCQPGEILVTKASLAPTGNPPEIVLCEGTSCVYGDDGNLHIEGQLPTPLPSGFYLYLPATIGATGQMQYLLNDGTLGIANFMRLF